MNVDRKNFDKSSTEQVNRSHFKDRLKKRKNAMLKTATTGVAVALAAISQQAEAALIVHEYDGLDLGLDPIINPLTGDFLTLGINDRPAGYFTLLGSSGGELFIGVSEGGLLVPDYVSIGGIIGDEVFPTETTRDYFDVSTFSSEYIGFEIGNQGAANDEIWYGYFEVEWQPHIFPDGDIANFPNLNSIVIDDSGSPLVVPTAVPEPSTSFLGGLAIVLAAFSRRRKPLA